MAVVAVAVDPEVMGEGIGLLVLRVPAVGASSPAGARNAVIESNSFQGYVGIAVAAVVAAAVANFLAVQFFLHFLILVGHSLVLRLDFRGRYLGPD